MGERGQAGSLARWTKGIAGAAVLISLITILARITGLGRYLVFSYTVGNGCLNTAYFTANQIPNIVFEVVAGGALAGMVVPVLAGHAANRPGDEHVSRVTSALLTWTVLVLVPLSVLVALAAGPIIGVFAPSVPGCDTEEVVAVATRMLIVFAPQIVLYGAAVVLYGVLQAHRRFLGPAVAPLVSSVIVIGAYLTFVPLSAGSRELAGLPRPAELALSVGTTLGVLALVITVVGPAGRLRLRLKPTLGFPPGVAAQARRLAAAGLAALLAQQAAMAIVVALANALGGKGAIGVYNYALAIYQVPYAVLAVPIATSAFTALSARYGSADQGGFDALAAASTRAVLLVSGAAAAVLAAVALPVAAVFVQQDTDPHVLARAIAGFAPGLLGFGLIAHLGRVLYACGKGRAAATATVTGWLVVIVAQTAFALNVPQDWVVGALGWGGTAGMTVGGGLLIVAVARTRGRSALRGLTRALTATIAGAAAAFTAGYAVVRLIGPVGQAASVGVAVLAAAAALAVFAGVVLVFDGGDLRAVLSRRVGTDG